MLVETLSYNLLFVAQLADMGSATFFDVGIVVLLWSKFLKVAFVGHVENGLYVIDFSEKVTKVATCLMAKVDVGLRMASAGFKGGFGTSIPPPAPLPAPVTRLHTHRRVQLSTRPATRSGLQDPMGTRECADTSPSSR
jgi:hypothetical protein